jgi:uncharacterized repeat protein (TIGR04076 family)
MFNEELARKYCTDGAICNRFEEGQEFVIEDLNQPKGFCAWAWDDIHKVILTLRSQGNFMPWMNDKDTIIACCTDGIRPVIFEVKRISA